MENYNDNELLYLIGENDDEARDLMLKKYKPLILANIKKLNLTKDERADFYQEGLIALTKAINTYNEHYFQSFNRYFTIILQRRYIDLLKKRTKLQKISYHENLDEYVVEAKKPDDDYYLQEEKLNLSDFELLVFQHRFINQEKPKAIATKLQCDVKRIYDALDRIRKKTRKK